MNEAGIRVYTYRWPLLAAYALMQGVIQMLWITFAPITGEAATYYGVTPLDIGFLSMLFMIVYLFVSVPASWAIDTHGLRLGAGSGAVLVGVFGFLRGFYGDRYPLVVAATVGLALAQPLLLNSVTRLAALWFPIQEAQYLGIVIAMWATPLLIQQRGIPDTLMIYGVVSAASAVVFLAILRERPPSPPCPPGQEARISVGEGLRRIFADRNMRLLLLIFFIGLGVFNAITTWIEQMVAPRGFDATQAGAAGAIMMIGGAAGTSVLPPLSDRFRSRKTFGTIALLGALPGLLGLTFATTTLGLLGSAFAFGLFSMSAGPIFYQYSAEVSYPAPEATSQGLLVLAGQVSGIAFIYGMDAFRAESGSMTPALLVLIALSIGNVLLTTRLRESALIRAEVHETGSSSAAAGGRVSRSPGTRE
jgi:fucose permease